jgi:ParB-like chromosome segregation protein Spo0J
MSELEDLCFKHVRSGVMRHDWRRFIRHDWERFLKPDWKTRMRPGSSVAADMYHQLKAEECRRRPTHYAHATPAEIAEKAADEEYQAELAELRGLIADLKRDLALKHLREKTYKANFNPSQPRFPKGTPVEGGR